MNTFMSRRLQAMPATGITVAVPIGPVHSVKVCGVRLSTMAFTRVYDDFSTVHYEGDVPIMEAVDRFVSGEG